MAFGYEKITKSIAKEISKQRAKTKKSTRKISYERQVFNALKRTNNQDKINHLQSTLSMLQKPTMIISNLKKDGLGTIIEDLIDPVSCIIIKNSFLPPKHKATLIKNIHTTICKLNIKANSDLSTQKNNETPKFKYVA